MVGATVSSDGQDALREEAAGWFARMRGPAADTHRAAFEAWRADPARAQAYAAMERRFEDSAILGHSRLADLRLNSASRPTGLKPLYPLIAALAACLVVAITVSTFVFGGAAEQRYATAVGQIRPVTLADGASMILDTDSVAIASTRGGHQVVRLERGRARFVAASKSDLSVTAGKAQLSASDATFDLAIAPQSQVDVTVISGAPRLGLAGDKLREVHFEVLPAGRQTLIGPDLARRRVQPASQVESAWPSGLRRFDQARLSDVAAVANRYNTRKIRLADPALADLRLTGVFRVTGSDSLAKALAAALGLDIEKAPSGDLVLSRPSA